MLYSVHVCLIFFLFNSYLFITLFISKKLKSALFHFTLETNKVGVIGSRIEMYICNYCKWKRVINDTTMFEHLLKKCLKCPPIVTQTSGQLTHINHRNSDSDSDSVNITTSSVQKKSTNEYNTICGFNQRQ